MGYALAHPLQDFDALDSYPFPDPLEPGLVEGLLDSVDRTQALIAGSCTSPCSIVPICLPGWKPCSRP